MSGKAGGRSGPAKNPKKTKQEPDDDDDFLDNLVMDTELDKRQPSYSNLEPGGFVTKAEDRKGRLEKRRTKKEMAKDDDDDDDDDEEKTEQERLEQEANELTSQLKKAERVETQAREKEQKDRAKCYSQRIMGG